MVYVSAISYYNQNTTLQRNPKLVVSDKNDKMIPSKSPSMKY